jgi:SAM-dependent methyltransferase
MAAMDPTTKRISDMYDRFPYPSPERGAKKLKELSNLLTIFSRETGFSFDGKSVLDAGTGTGHRLLDAAATFRQTSFTGIDISERPLEIAKETALAEGMTNVDFRRHDLMAEPDRLGTFDVVLCMGVLHHLSDPLRGLNNLAGRLSEEGLLFLYLYGEPGSQERMRRKRIVAALRGDRPDDFELGIMLIKELGFDAHSYGWNLSIDDEKTRESLLVDSYLNVHERLFDAGTIRELFAKTDLGAFMTYGITVDQSGYLFDTRMHPPVEILLQKTEMHAKLPTPLLAEAYNRLTLEQKYALIDLLYKPNGYTILGFRNGAEKLFKPGGRILMNAVRSDGHR